VRYDLPVASGNSTNALKVMRLIDTVYQNERHSRAYLYDHLHA
jgi:hypothetical protein